MSGTELARFEADADSKPVNLNPGDSVKYCVSWKFDPIAVENEGVMELMGENIIRVSWTNESGISKEEILLERE
jgi:hypothetical protein